jgi:hypothetical protein
MKTTCSRLFYQYADVEFESAAVARAAASAERQELGQSALVCGSATAAAHRLILETDFKLKYE